MAANDYHVIVYQILAYLYACLKDGVDVDLASIEQFKEKTIIQYDDHKSDYRSTYPQLRAMRSLSKILKGIVFEEMKL